MDRAPLQALRERLAARVIGSEDAAELLLTALLARGHVLIEGAPGIGKTTMAETLARAIGGEFRRIQFTPDLMPADLLGYNLYRMDHGDFEFVPGPVFAHCVLADEINRTSPRVQSALLECMNDGQVSIDGQTRPLPRPFQVIATRNDIYATGTFPLPEPQLDRFLLSIEMTLPDSGTQRRIVLEHAGDSLPAADAAPLTTPDEVLALQDAAARAPVSEAIGAYLVELCESLRRLAGADHAVSVRASLAVMQAARARAFLDECPAVHPEHVQAVFAPVMRHRVVTDDGADTMVLIDAALEKTPVP